MYNFSINFLKFYQEFFQEDGFKWSLKETNNKLIEDKIKDTQIRFFLGATRPHNHYELTSFVNFVWFRFCLALRIVGLATCSC